MKHLILLTCYNLLLSVAINAYAQVVSVGAAPSGDPKKVAEKIIKLNFGSACNRVSTASRLSDGTIRATCNGNEYRVFTMYDPSKGEMMELALNCTFADSLARSKGRKIDCFKQ
jgi:hypothetical protein